jgi:excisionase family DNA binding protein
MSITQLEHEQFRLFDIKEAANLLSLSPWTLRKWVAAGKLRPVRLGRRVLLEQAELERFVAAAREGR